MSKLTFATAALLVLLAGFGTAEAATVTLSIDIVDTELEVGETTAYTISATVTDNFTEVFDVYSLNGGLFSYIIDQSFTSDGGQITNTALFNPNPAADRQAAITVPSPFNANAQNGFLVDATGAKVKVVPGVGGVSGSGGGATLPADKWGFVTDASPYTIGNGTATTLFTGTYEAVADGVVDITTDAVFAGGLEQILVWTLTDSGVTAANADVVVGASAQITVGSVVAGNPPSVTIDTADVAEGDWSQEAGWNNPVHSVQITATGSDNDGETQGLTWLWEINDGTGFKAVTDGTDDGTLDLTIQALLDAGCVLPPAYASGEDHSTDPAYVWDLQVTVTDPDGSATDTMSVFVPEPTTMALLGFGLVGLLRRRRA